jgi:hypothetical protein
MLHRFLHAGERWWTKISLQLANQIDAFVNSLALKTKPTVALESPDTSPVHAYNSMSENERCLTVFAGGRPRHVIPSRSSHTSISLRARLEAHHGIFSLRTTDCSDSIESMPVVFNCWPAESAPCAGRLAWPEAGEGAFAVCVYTTPGIEGKMLHPTPPG